MPERERRGIYREFIGRSVARQDIEPMRDAPFEADFTLQSLPGLTLVSGSVHGSCNRRTRELLADGQLERVHIGVRSFVTRRSINAYIDRLLATTA